MESLLVDAVQWRRDDYSCAYVISVADCDAGTNNNNQDGSKIKKKKTIKKFDASWTDMRVMECEIY